MILEDIFSIKLNDVGRLHYVTQNVSGEGTMHFPTLLSLVLSHFIRLSYF